MVTGLAWMTENLIRSKGDGNCQVEKYLTSWHLCRLEAKKIELAFFAKPLQKLNKIDG